MEKKPGIRSILGQIQAIDQVPQLLRKSIENSDLKALLTLLNHGADIDQALLIAKELNRHNVISYLQTGISGLNPDHTKQVSSEPPITKEQTTCKANTKRNQRCKHKANTTGYCWQHQP